MPSSPQSRRSQKSALVILDMLSEFGFPDGASVKRAALRIADPIAKLRSRARRRGVAVIYVNDTSGHWESDQQAFIERCLEGRGARITELLRPAPDDYFMFKPKHSAFYGTPLAELLYMLDVKHLVLTGVSSHQCVLLTASDAHIRGFDVSVAVDCIAAPHAAATRHATYILDKGLQARIGRAQNIRF